MDRPLYVGTIAETVNNYGTQSSYVGPSFNKPKAPQELHKFPPRSIYFHGRKDELQEIQKAIEKCQEGTTSYARSVVISGFEGMGKSEIIKNLAAKWKQQYGFVYWLDAQSESNLNAEFHELFTVLTSQRDHFDGHGVPPPIKNVYYILAKEYDGNGILIFDNAEYLKTENGIFGMDKFLEPELHCKKPVFVITCRDASPFESENIMCLPPLDPLALEESYNCLIQYLDLTPQDKKDLPEALQGAVKDLASLVGGHPLGLSLIGNAIAKDRREHNKLKKSFHNIMSNAKRYIDNLRNEPSVTTAYTQRLENIFSSTVERLGEIGNVANDVLSIVAHLSPDNIYMDLVQSIYLEMDFIPGEKFFLKSYPDPPQDERIVRAGLVVLVTNNIIKLENKEYTNTKKHLFDYIMIRMHRLLHGIIRNRTSNNPPLKITKFFECTSSVNFEFREHIKFILNNYVNGEIHLEIASILMLSLQLGEQNLFVKVQNRIRDDTLLNGSDEEIALMLLGELFQGDSADEPSQQSSSPSDISNSVYKLSSDFGTKYWVIEMCIYLMRHISKKNSTKDYPNSSFSDWVIKNYMKCQQPKRRYCDVIKIVYLCDLSRDCTQDGEFLWKVFSCTADHQRWRFWHDMEIICTSDKLDPSQRKNILRHLFHPSKSDLFTQYIDQISTCNDTRKLFLEDWCMFFTACVKELLKDSELAKLLLEPNTFHNAFLKITCLLTQDIESAYNSADIENVPQWETGLVNLIETWCKLFSIDTDMYNHVSVSLDAAIENWLEARCQRSGDKNKIYGSGQYINEWSDSINCSPQSNKWMKELSSKLFAKIPPSN